MTKVEIAKLFLKILRIKGKVSYNNAGLIVKELILQFDTENTKEYYDIIYPLSICGLIEFSNNYWYVCSSIAIKYNDKYKFINNTYIEQEPIQDIKEINNLNNIEIIPIKQYESLLYQFPYMYNVGKYASLVKRSPEIMYHDKKNTIIENSSLLNEYEIIRDSKEVYGQRYVKYNSELYKLENRENNPDSILYAKLNEYKNKIIKENNEVIIYKPTMPITLGRLLFVLSDMQFEDAFQDNYKFILKKQYINQIKRIMGIK